MSAIRERQNGTRLVLVALAATVALLAAGVRGAAAAPAATLTPTNTCWLQVVNDWLDHNGEIRGLYPIPCYTQAIQHLSEYPDIQQYSNAIDDIHRALLSAIQDERGDGPGSGPPSSGGNTGGQTAHGGGGPKPPTKPGGGGGGGQTSPIATIFHPSNAQSIPLPLIVLAALALLLLLAGAGTWLARRLQARRMTPATAPAPQQPR